MKVDWTKPAPILVFSGFYLFRNCFRTEFFFYSSSRFFIRNYRIYRPIIRFNIETSGYAYTHAFRVKGLQIGIYVRDLKQAANDVNVLMINQMQKTIKYNRNSMQYKRNAREKKIVNLPL